MGHYRPYHSAHRNPSPLLSLSVLNFLLQLVAFLSKKLYNKLLHGQGEGLGEGFGIFPSHFIWTAFRSLLKCSPLQFNYPWLTYQSFKSITLSIPSKIHLQIAPHPSSSPFSSLHIKQPYVCLTQLLLDMSVAVNR